MELCLSRHSYNAPIHSESRTNHNDGAKNERTRYDYSFAPVKSLLVRLSPQVVKLINVTMIFAKWYLFLFKFLASI